MNKDKIKAMMKEQVKKLDSLIEKMNIPEPAMLPIKDITNVEESVLDNIKELNKKPIVYLIMLKENLNNLNSPEDITKIFTKTKKNQKESGKGDWYISDINASNWKLDSRCLYVGRSYGKIITRMKQHLAVGNLSRNTYSLWLKDWFKESKLPREIEIYFLEFENMSSEHIYMIEDLLWKSLSPLFGRPGKSPRSK